MHVRRPLAASLILIATGAVAAAAAGCSDEETSPGSKADASTPRDSGGTKADGGASPDGATVPDATTSDGATTPDTSTPTPDAGTADGSDGAVAPILATGTRLLTGAHDVLGITSDDYVVYKDVAENAVKAIPLAGGQAITLASNARVLGENTGVLISGRAVFIWTDMDFEKKGRLRAWSQAAGTAQQLAATGQYGEGTSRAIASADGTKVVFAAVSALADGGAQIDLQGATLSATQPTPVSLVTAIDTSNACRIDLAFAGNGTALTSACAEGTTTRVVRAFDAGGSFAGRAVLTSADPEQEKISVSASGNRALVYGATSGGAGTTPAMLVGLEADAGAAEVAAANVAEAYLSPDGASIVYQTAGGALHRKVIGGADTELLNAGVTEILAVSPDFRWALTSGDSQTNDAGVSDAGDFLTLDTRNVTLASLESAVSSPLVGTLTGSAGWGRTPGGDGFTKDGTHALFFSGVVPPGVGTFTSRAIGDAGTASKTPGGNATWVRAVVGSKVVIAENVTYVAGVARADVRAFDTSGVSDTGTVLATRVVGVPSVTAAGTKVVYASPNAPSGAGVFVADVP